MTVASNVRSRLAAVVLQKISKFSFLLRSAPALFLLLVLVMAVFANLIAPFDPNQQDLGNPLVGPTWQHIMGTDLLAAMYSAGWSSAAGFLSSSAPVRWRWRCSSA